jgi:hypothetical protein
LPVAKTPLVHVVVVTPVAVDEYEPAKVADF